MRRARKVHDNDFHDGKCDYCGSDDAVVYSPRFGAYLCNTCLGMKTTKELGF